MYHDFLLVDLWEFTLIVQGCFSGTGAVQTVSPESTICDTVEVLSGDGDMQLF